MKSLLEIIARHKAGKAVGIYSVCCAHPLIIEAALRFAKQQGSPALIEATSNQVNQEGGYTGLRPADFARLVHEIAARVGLPPGQLMLGGDHLGPNSWQQLSAETAMRNAERLIADYVTAGFRKIHLDCSMSCAGDPVPLSDSTVAARAARLCAIAEQAWRQAGGEAPVYVVGTEVPVPGGAHEALHELTPTAPAAAAATIAAHRRAFDEVGLHDAWSRVIGLVVQPGVEFDHYQVVDFQPGRVRELSAVVATQKQMLYEAHSTDYQTADNLRALVRGHFAILKVGPALSFALREALFALDQIETELLGSEHASGLRRTLLKAMESDPRYWQRYYSSSGAQLRLDWQYSLSDRIRYYWPQPAVSAALERLFANFGERAPPLALLSQYLPAGYQAVREGRIKPDARELAMHHVGLVLGQYAAACGQSVSRSDDASAA
jgi:D-tagatose-1,6-bisphosphate aldolase subunit GatZ/KbaZ